MNKILFSILIVLGGLNAVAGESRTLSAVVTCSKVSPEGTSLVVGIVEGSRGGSRLLVVVNKRLMFDKEVVSEVFPGQTYYHSSSFINANNAPSSFKLKLYGRVPTMVGVFSEISYKPEGLIGYELGHGMQCHPFSSITIGVSY